MRSARAVLLAAILLAGAPAGARAQVFVASRPNPEFQIGPLFVRASVSPALGPVTVDIYWSVVVPPRRSAADLEQDVYLLWPGAVTGDPKLGRPDTALERYVEERGFTALESGRLALFARNLYAGDARRSPPEAIAGGAPFVTFVRETGPLGLTSPGTWIRIPWSPRIANRAWLMDLRLPARAMIKDKPDTWLERLLWGRRHRITLSFNEVRSRVLFPMYFQHRDRILRLSEDPAQLVINFADSEHLKIDELSPPTARRQLSETLETTETVSVFVDRSEGLTPQVLSVQFGYFSGWQSWAPILIPALAFLLGNLAGPIVRAVAERVHRRLSGRVALGRQAVAPVERQRGVVLSRERLARIVPGQTTYEEVLALCGPDVEEHESLATPHRRVLVYRGQRVVAQRRRIFSWLAAVTHWAVEHHEVEITLEGDRVADVQARVRRSRLVSPAAPQP